MFRAVQERDKSYNLDQFEDDRAEIDRLKQQATVALALEKRVWVEMGIGPGTSVLDAGCGHGIASRAFAELVAPAPVVGIDLNDELLAEARRDQAADPLENLDFRRADLFDLDLPEKPFDFAYSRFVFQHLDRPLVALENVRDVLRPGGRFSIVDVDDRWLMFEPGSEHLETVVALADEGQALRGGNRRLGGKLPGLFDAAGFEDIQVRVEVITSKLVGIEGLFNLTVAFMHEQAPAPETERAKREIAALKGVLDGPGAFGAIGIFCVTGRRPG